MYREAVGSSGCFHAPETKCDAPGGDRAHQAAVHLRRSVDKFSDWGGGRGCNIFVPVLGGNSTKIAPTGDIFDQPPGQMQ